MMELQATEKERTGRMLILGFDAGCGTCRDIARRVEGRVGDALTVRNLSDPELMNWREEALGKDAPFAPTLFEIEGKTVRAWTGKKMALPLSRKLGISKTWQLMQALGDMPNSGIQPVDSPGVGMSRGKFLKGVGGAAVAMSVLSGVGSLASIAQAAETSPHDIVSYRKLKGSELSSTANRIGSSADVRTVVGQALSTPTKVNLADPEIYLHTLRNETALRVAMYHISDTRLVTHVEYTDPPKNQGATRALLFVKSANEVSIVRASELGRVWQIDSSEETQSARQVRTTSNSNEPLGQCPAVSSRPPAVPGVYWSRQKRCANWSLNLGCVGTANGTLWTCIGCGGSLAARQPSPSACGGCGTGVALTGATCCSSYKWVWVATNYS